MKFDLRVSGAAQLAATLRELPESVRRRTLLKVLRVAAEPMRARAAQLAPRSTRRLSGTGGDDEHLADHIGISVATRIGSVAGGQWQAVDEFQAAVAVGPTRGFFYGLFQEYGTTHHGARPFMRPAFDGQGDTSLDLIRRGLWAEIDRRVRASSSRGTSTGGGTL